ncbi:MAG: RNA 2',3'-cyclic phosphodiesterase [Chloroflexota bacterium]
MRAFIAVDLPVSLQDAIQQQTVRLRQALDSSLVRWTPAHNIHLTLKFLGDISPANLELLREMLTREAEQHPAFDMRLADLGSFPTSRRPHVIWVGLHAPTILESLQRGIESAAARLGYGPEERPFSPHLTIGRVRQNLSTQDAQKIRLALETTKIGELGTARVDCAHLYKSDLQPGGSVYTKLFSARLKKD